jgi:hypothetical protein
MGLNKRHTGNAIPARGTGLKRKGTTPIFPVVAQLTKTAARHRTALAAVSTGIRPVPVMSLRPKLKFGGPFHLGYTPTNLTVYTAAYSGIISGLTGSSRVLLDTDEDDYAGFASIAGAFAASFDEAWTLNPDTNPPDTLQVFVIEKTCKAVWEDRFTEVNTETLSTSTFTEMCDAIIALVLASEAYFASQGITPDPWPSGGGGGGVTEVDAGTGISVTGTASVPIVNNLGILSVTAGSGIAITGPAQTPTVATDATVAKVIITTSSYVQPAIGSSIFLAVTSTSGLVPGEGIVIGNGGGGYMLLSISGSTNLTAVNLGGPTNAAAGMTIGNTATISPGLASEQQVDGVPGSNGLTQLVNANGITFPEDAASPSIGQASTGASTGQGLTIYGQQGIGTNFTPQPVTVVVPNSQGSGSFGSAQFFVAYGDKGIIMGGIGINSALGPTWVSRWALPPDSGLVPDAGNCIESVDPSGNVYWNAGTPFFAAGTFNFSFGEQVNSVYKLTNLGAFIGLGAQLAGGTGVIGVGAASVVPTQTLASVSTAGGTAYSNAGDFTFLAGVHTGSAGQKGFLTTLAATANTSDPSTQKMINGQHLLVGTTISNATLVMTVTPATDGTGTFGDLWIKVVGRTSVAGATGAIGEGAKFLLSGAFSTIGGALTIIGATTTVSTQASTSLAGTTVTLTASAASYVITITPPANAGAHVDWTILTGELDN